MSWKGLRTVAALVAVVLLTSAASATAHELLPPAPSWLIRITGWALLLATYFWAVSRHSGKPRKR